MAGRGATTSNAGAYDAATPSVALRDVTIAFRLADGATYTAVQHASLAAGPVSSRST